LDKDRKRRIAKKLQYIFYLAGLVLFLRGLLIDADDCYVFQASSLFLMLGIGVGEALDRVSGE